MSYRVNGRNLAVGRLMLRGKNADKRMKYVHVSAKGTSVITPNIVARVSLPQPVYGEPATIIPQEQIDKERLPAECEDIIELPPGLPAVTQPDYLVPQIDKCFPQPEHVTATFT